jgi:hypothetical protein
VLPVEREPSDLQVPHLEVVELLLPLGLTQDLRVVEVEPLVLKYNC